MKLINTKKEHDKRIYEFTCLTEIRYAKKGEQLDRHLEDVEKKER